MLKEVEKQELLEDLEYINKMINFLKKVNLDNKKKGTGFFGKLKKLFPLSKIGVNSISNIDIDSISSNKITISIAELKNEKTIEKMVAFRETAISQLTIGLTKIRNSIKEEIKSGEYNID